MLRAALGCTVDTILALDESCGFLRQDAGSDAGPASRPWGWKEARAFEVHEVLSQVSAAAHAIDVCLAALLRRMDDGRGFQRWGHTGLAGYLTQELRQPSARRFRYLAAIDRAIAKGPLPRLGNAWKRGTVTVCQARELIRVMTPDNEAEWLEVAASVSVARLAELVTEAVRKRRAEALTTRPEQEPEQEDEASTQGSAAASSGAGRLDPEREEDDWRACSFEAASPLYAAWQVALETSRRLAGFDLPVHECVDDFLAEHSSGYSFEALSFIPAGLPADQEPPGAAAGWSPLGWHEASHAAQEAARLVGPLRRTARQVRFRSDPMAGLDPGGKDDPADLHRRIRWLLRLEGALSWHEGRLLRLVAAMKLFRRLGASSLEQYAVELLGRSRRGAWWLVSLTKALHGLPKVASAWRQGLITALEAKEVSRVARPATQDEWLARARCSTLRALREDIAFVLDEKTDPPLPPRRTEADDPPGCAPGPAGAAWKGGPETESEAGRPVEEAAPGPVRPRLQTCARGGKAPLRSTLASRADRWRMALEKDRPEMVRRVLGNQRPHRVVRFSLPASLAAVWEAELARLGSQWPWPELAPTTGRLAALILLGFIQQWGFAEPECGTLAHKVMVRDGWRCQAPYCETRGGLNAHHMVFLSRGGPDEEWNMVCVCRAHHASIHDGRMAVRGRAPDRVEWAMGLDAEGTARERWMDGIRTGWTPGWSAERPPQERLASPTDWARVQRPDGAAAAAAAAAV
ncbi:MAG TPA: HNH endonuclease signature motif containing protein [Candidatus Polarisedimenticolia bacterium]|nr:HNH endonuclease signature motif containing protein [Candidatus Polarisedimenticolia bacterium]